jgi:MFS family permease
MRAEDDPGEVARGNPFARLLRPERLLPLIVACALFIENMDSTVISTSLPAIARDLGTDPVEVNLALTTYLLSLAVFIPVSGWVADRFGARRTFASAIGVFLLGSLACAASGSLGTLVAARFLQGMGGAMMVPVGRLVLLRAVPKERLVHALSWLTIPALVGPVVGPPLGGFITTYFDWRWIFLINLPMGALGIVLGLRYIPSLRQPVADLDWRGFLLSGLGLAMAIFGFSTLGRRLLPGWVAVAALLVGLALLAGYVRHARRQASPLLDLGLFRPGTPHWLVIAVLLAGGCFRSLQFTALNAISYDEVDARRMGQASSMAGMMQQLSLALGVAIGGYALDAAGWLRQRPATDVHNFYLAFAAVALVSASSALLMRKLPRDAGAAMAGRARPGDEIAEPKPAQLPAT